MIVHWTPEEIAYLCAQWPKPTPTGVIAEHLGRTECAIYTKARDLHLYRGRKGRKKRVMTPRRARAIVVRREPAPTPPRVDIGSIVSAALQARTELERAWGVGA